MQEKMTEQFTVAITGDAIINRRISVSRDEGFLSLVRVIREADIGYTHLETLVHDYDGPEIYPAAEAGWTWMRSPHFVPEELKWAGFDIVSHASNHSLDYSYGGLYSTWKALDEAGLPYAGIYDNADLHLPSQLVRNNAGDDVRSTAGTISDSHPYRFGRIGLRN